jgi:hypothetical protein
MIALEDLVTREASGVLEVNGSPSGAVYLDGGRIAFARASWVPGLAARLRAVSPALDGLREMPPGGPDGNDGADDAAVAGLAVQRGFLTVAGVRDLITSIVVDAFLVLTVPLAVDSPVAGIRFTATRTDWTEMFPRLRIDRVREEAFKKAERLAEQGLAPTTAVALCDLRAPAAVLTREQWAVACRIGSHASALDLAARRGAALTDTLECLGSLARAGLCAPVRAGGRGHAASRMPGPVRPTGSSTQTAPAEPLPARHPAQEHQAQDRPAQDRPAQDRRAQDRRAPAVGPGRPPTMDILRQVLDGLKKLS